MDMCSYNIKEFLYLIWTIEITFVSKYSIVEKLIQITKAHTKLLVCVCICTVYRPIHWFTTLITVKTCLMWPHEAHYPRKSVNAFCMLPFYFVNLTLKIVFTVEEEEGVK